MITYAQLFNVREVLEQLAGERMPSRTSLRLARIARQVFDALDDFDKTRVRLLKTYAEYDGDTVKLDDGEVVWKGEDGEQEFRAQMKEALDTEVDGLSYQPIQLKHWPKSRELAPREALALAEANILTE